MRCDHPLWKAFFQCCSVEESSQVLELKLNEHKLNSPRSTKRPAALSIQATELTSHIAVSDYDAEGALSERNPSSLHETVQHMCSESATSFGDSLLSFKKAMRAHVNVALQRP
mmetsp:Transcript_9889/g.19628  ORF Transcript_9889/g.19628 Transcript_9889/m.19628 type:complete len:113 (-) Transcript_9889:48-386(-)